MSRNFVRSLSVLAAAFALFGVVAAAQAFSPLSVAGLQAWQNPSATSTMTSLGLPITNGAKVSAMVDSANGTTWTSNDGVVDPTYNGKDYRPTYNATALNGQPGIVYSNAGGTGQMLSLVNNWSILNLATSNTQLDFFGVFSTMSAGTNEAFWSNNGGSQYFRLRSTGGFGFQFPSQEYTSPTGLVATNGTPQIVELVFNAGNVQAYLNGTSVWTASGLPTGIASYTLVASGTQGANSDGHGDYSGFNGALGDMLWYNQVLSSTDRNNVGAYLQTAYGIQVVYVGTYVPEPSTLVLLAAGLAGLLCYAWRKRR